MVKLKWLKGKGVDQICIFSIASRLYEKLKHVSAEPVKNLQMT